MLTKNINLVKASMIVGGVSFQGDPSNHYIFELYSDKRGKVSNGAIRSYAGNGITDGVAVEFPSQWINNGAIDQYDSLYVQMTAIGSPATISVVEIILTIEGIPRITTA